MTRRFERTRDERGQTLVMFVVFLAGLIVLFAFVIDVGAWLGTHRKLQSVADSAALATVQTGAVGPAIDDGWATIALPTVTYNNSPTLPQLVESAVVTASRSAPIILGGVAGISGITERATASAQAEAVTTLGNGELAKVAPAPPTSPYIAPLAVNACVFGALTCTNPPSSPCVPPGGCDLSYDPSDRPGSLLGIANICPQGSAGCDPSDPANSSNFQNWVTCNPCELDSITVPATFDPMTQGIGDEANPAVKQLVGREIVVPVFDPTQLPVYTVVGFAALHVTAVNHWGTEGTCSPYCKVITGYFSDYTLPASFGGTTTAQDFGVRAIGLTN
jgi:Flp pilus assembly protein TadG